MTEYNPSKLVQELENKGLAVEGADSTGRIFWIATPSKEDLRKADIVKNKHNPVDLDQLRKMLYPQVTDELIYKTLKHFQSNKISLGENAEEWISQVEAVKEKYPEE